MIIIVCKECGTAVRTSGEHEEVDCILGTKCDWFPDRYPCPSAGCRGLGEMVDQLEPGASQYIDLHDLTVQEAFAAFHGLGMPEERDCGPTAVTEAFKVPVKSLDAKLLKGSNRTIIYSIEFENGTRMYLASSAYGALVYRIATPRKYSDEVTDER